jgi:hypothetical protein
VVARNAHALKLAQARRREQLAARRRAVRVAERTRRVHHRALHVRGATRQDISVAQR